MSRFPGYDSGEKLEPCGRKEQVWCEQATWSLLNAYEEKWRELEWGNLKGKHWEELSSSLSCYSNGQWPVKSPIQCKNKIEDLKKKYKDKIQRGSSTAFKWPYFSRIDGMFRNAAKDGGFVEAGTSNDPANLASCMRFGEQEIDEPEGFDEEDDESEEGEEELSLNVNCKRKGGGGVELPARKHKKGWSDAAAAIRSLGEALVRIESSKLECQRQLLQMQAQAEARRMEMEMKRTEMFLSMQIQLAKLVSESMKKKCGTSCEDAADQQAD